MKRILVITRNFPPLWGGMERLNLHLVDECARRFDVCLVAPEGAAQHARPSVRTREVPLRPLWRFILSAAWQAMREARRWKPDLILAGSGLTAPLALLAARLCGARAYAYVHGLDLTVPHVVYRALWLPAIRRMDGIIANSGATAGLAVAAGVAQQRLSIIPPGVSLPEYDAAARNRFRNGNALQGHSVLLSVGRLAARKGLREFVSNVLPIIVSKRPDTMLVVVGGVPSNALYSHVQTPENIQAAADGAGVGKNLRFLGSISEASLLDAYAAADLHVFPVRHIPDDPEGFGMVAVEAAAHGLATVAYATGGVVDAVADGVSGGLVEPGDDAGFARAVLALLDEPLAKEEILNFAAGFSWGCFGERMAAAIEASLATAESP